MLATLLPAIKGHLPNRWNEDPIICCFPYFRFSVSGELNLYARNSKKTRLKTPSQVMGRIIWRRKLPCKMDEIGDCRENRILTEKQVSRWFCCRRCKDNMKGEEFQNGRLDRLSGVVLDHESGQKRDSCGSTKQRNYRLVEHREVESHGFSGETLCWKHKQHR